MNRFNDMCWVHLSLDDDDHFIEFQSIFLISFQYYYCCVMVLFQNQIYWQTLEKKILLNSLL